MIVPVSGDSEVFKDVVSPSDVKASHAIQVSQRKKSSKATVVAKDLSVVGHQNGPGKSLQSRKRFVLRS